MSNKPDFKIADIKLYKKNAKKHPPEQVKKIAESIKAFGCLQPMIVDDKGVIIVGHGRFMAMTDILGWTEIEQRSHSLKGDKVVPYILVDNLTEDEVKAYRLADNKLNESGWNEEILIAELATLDGSMLEIAGFGLDYAPIEQQDNPYTSKIDVPTYEPSGDTPRFSDMVNTDRRDQLILQIEGMKIAEDEKTFLKNAAHRFSAFHYGKIADYYAGASPEIQDMMEKLALVIIDYDKAIENGFVQLSDKLRDSYLQDYEI